MIYDFCIEIQKYPLHKPICVTLLKIVLNCCDHDNVRYKNAVFATFENSSSMLCILSAVKASLCEYIIEGKIA